MAMEVCHAGSWDCQDSFFRAFVSFGMAPPRPIRKD